MAIHTLCRYAQDLSNAGFDFFGLGLKFDWASCEEIPSLVDWQLNQALINSDCNVSSLLDVGAYLQKMDSMAPNFARA